MHSVVVVQVVDEARFDSQAYLDLGRSLCQWASSEGDIIEWDSNQWGITGMSSERLVMSCVCMCVCVCVCLCACACACACACVCACVYESLLMRL